LVGRPNVECTDDVDDQLGWGSLCASQLYFIVLCRPSCLFVGEHASRRTVIKYCLVLNDVGASGDFECLLLLGSKKQHALALYQQMNCSKLVTSRGIPYLVCVGGLPSVVQTVVVDLLWFNIRHRQHATQQCKRDIGLLFLAHTHQASAIDLQ